MHDAPPRGSPHLGGSHVRDAPHGPCPPSHSTGSAPEPSPPGFPDSAGAGADGTPQPLVRTEALVTDPVAADTFVLLGFTRRLRLCACRNRRGRQAQSGEKENTCSHG